MTLALRLMTTVALFASSPAFAQTAAPATPQGAATAPATVDADPALWVVRDADTTIYLFGTVHVLKPGLSWFDEAVADAFNRSDELVLEIADSDAAAAQQFIASHGVATDGMTVSQRLTPEQLALYTRALGSVNLPAANLDPLDPWVPGIILSVLPLTARGYDAEQGAEMTLTRAAQAAHKPISGLETQAYQLGLFDAMTPAQQVEFLMTAAKSAVSADDELGELISLWSAGQPEQLGAQMNKEFADFPDLQETLLTNRNRNWADWIATKLAAPGGHYFIAVGAGHLAGDNSVQSLLASRGITVTRVNY